MLSEFFTTATLAVLSRYGLAMAGTMLTTAGYLSGSDWQAISGAIVALGTSVYAAVYKKPKA